MKEQNQQDIQDVNVELEQRPVETEEGMEQQKEPQE
jgi:hypothetical protein